MTTHSRTPRVTTYRRHPGGSRMFSDRGTAIPGHIMPILCAPTRDRWEANICPYRRVFARLTSASPGRPGYVRWPPRSQPWAVSAPARRTGRGARWRSAWNQSRGGRCGFMAGGLGSAGCGECARPPRQCAVRGAQGGGAGVVGVPGGAGGQHDEVGLADPGRHVVDDGDPCPVAVHPGPCAARSSRPGRPRAARGGVVGDQVTLAEHNRRAVMNRIGWATRAARRPR